MKATLLLATLCCATAAQAAIIPADPVVITHTRYLSLVWPDGFLPIASTVTSEPLVLGEMDTDAGVVTLFERDQYIPGPDTFTDSGLDLVYEGHTFATRVNGGTLKIESHTVAYTDTPGLNRIPTGGPPGTVGRGSGWQGYWNVIVDGNHGDIFGILGNRLEVWSEIEVTRDTEGAILGWRPVIEWKERPSEIEDFTFHHGTIPGSQIEIWEGVETDVNADGLVGGGDFVAIQRSHPMLVPEWQYQYGHVTAISAFTAATIPEPATWLLVLVAVPCWFIRRFSR